MNRCAHFMAWLFPSPPTSFCGRRGTMICQGPITVQSRPFFFFPFFFSAPRVRSPRPVPLSAPGGEGDRGEWASGPPPPPCGRETNCFLFFCTTFESIKTQTGKATTEATSTDSDLPLPPFFPLFLFPSCRFRDRRPRGVQGCGRRDR